jgi:hypothetical protein
LPSYIEVSEDNGVNIDVSELKLPRISVAQNVSKAVEAGDVKAGVFYSSLGEDMGNEIEICIIDFDITYVAFKDGKFAGRSYDGTTWTEGDLRGQALTEEESFHSKRYNFYVINVNEPDPLPYVLSLYSSSGGKAGSKLYNKLASALLRKMNKVKPYAFTFKLNLNKTSNNKGTFFEVLVSNFQGTPSEKVYMTAKEAAKFKDENKHRIVVDETPAESAPKARPTAEPCKEEF